MELDDNVSFEWKDDHLTVSFQDSIMGGTSQTMTFPLDVSAHFKMLQSKWPDKFKSLVNRIAKLLGQNLYMICGSFYANDPGRALHFLGTGLAGLAGELRSIEYYDLAREQEKEANRSIDRLLGQEPLS